MKELDPNLVVIVLAIIALVAIAYGKNELAEKAIAGVGSLAKEIVQMLRRLS